MRVLRSLMSLVVVLAVGVPTASNAAGAAAPGYVQLDDSFAALREAFNAGRGHVRLLFVVDSSCPMCLKGMADIDDALLATTADPRLDTFVVHVPVIGGDEDDIAPSAQLLHNARVRHYWNASGAFGGRLSAVAGLSSGDDFVYAWDVWLVYGPDAVWAETDPPKPDVLMHQLPFLRNRPEFPRLDAERFAREVQARLERLPPAVAAAKATVGEEPKASEKPAPSDD